MKWFYFLQTLKMNWLNLVAAVLCTASGTISIVDIVHECIEKDTGAIIYDIFWILVTFGLAIANLWVFKKRYNTLKRVFSN